MGGCAHYIESEKGLVVMSEKQTTALIVDDEPLARKGLRELLAAHSEIDIMGEAARLSEARALVAQTAPDLIFLDIQLYGESGFDLLENLPEKSAVIFVTAFDRYAVRAFEVNALDYLLKPITPERLELALARHTPRTADAVLQKDDRVFLKLGRKSWFEPLKNISAICADNDHSSVWLAHGKQVVVRRSLQEWERMLSAPYFMRTHRKSIVNLSAVCAFKTVAEGGLHLQVDGSDEPIPVSRRHAAELHRRLKMLQ